MIKQINQFNIDEQDNLFLAKIKSNFLCYNKFDFSKTFIQEIQNSFTSLIGILDNSLTIFCNEKADFDEINGFINAVAVKTVFCDVDIANKLKVEIIEQGVILKYQKSDLESYYNLTNCPDYKKIYSNLSWNKNKPDYNNFVSDLSYRINHSFARCISCDFGDIFTGWETKTNAVISAISVNQNERGKGLGSKLLKSLVTSLTSENKNIFVYCDCPQREQFYKNNGFISMGFYAVGNRKD